MRSLQVNGRMRHFPPQEMPATLSELVELLGIASGTVVAEVDGKVFSPEQFPHTPLRDGQTVELIKFMGGG